MSIQNKPPETTAPQGGSRSEHLAADSKMDDDTGLSNTANKKPVAPDQSTQSNVGRRDDGTPD